MACQLASWLAVFARCSKHARDFDDQKSHLQVILSTIIIVKFLSTSTTSMLPLSVSESPSPTNWFQSAETML